MVPFSPSRTGVPANLRDLGGIRTDDGYVLRPGVLFRGDAPQPGDPRTAGGVGLAPATAWPPATVLDLRSGHEVRGGHPMADVARIHPVPLGASLAPERVATTPPGERDITWVYRRLAAEAMPRFAGVVALLAREPGPVLVHCAAGKDRTGLVVAVVLAALGVPRERILADYLRTNDHVDALWARLTAAGVPAPDHDSLLGVRSSALEAVLDDLADGPGGVHGHLLRTGTDAAELRRLAERLLVPAAPAA